MLWLVASQRKQRGACAASNIRWVFVLRPKVECRGGKLLAQALVLIQTHTHVRLQAAALLQQSPSVKGKRDFDSLSAKLIENCQCFERLCFTWVVQALSILTIPELAKNSSKRNREFLELWSYQFCIIWLTIPLEVFILPLVKIKSAHSLVQELTSLWCYILCNGVRPGKAFTAKPRSELNLQCLSPCLQSDLPPAIRVYLYF